MADWENIPRLDPALQDEIDNVQLKHTELVEAVRGYSGGSIAGKTNEVMGTHQDNLDTVATREKTLLSAVGQPEPEPAPSMLLDFASQTYFTGIRGLEQAVDPHKYLNVSRSTSKWVMGPQGKLVEVPPNTLAYEYDPVTGEAKGVLIEESRTNISLASDFSARWGAEDITFEDETVMSFDGVTKAVRKVVPNTNDTIHFIYQGYWAVTPDTTYTQHMWVPSDAPYSIRFIYRSHGTSPRNSGTGAEVIEQRNGWNHISYTFTTPSDCSDLQLRLYLYSGNSINYAGDGTTGLLVDGHQLEEGSQPSSYIPTTDSSVTRAADSVTRVLGDEFNNNGFTIYASGTQIANTGTYFSIVGPGGYAENGVRAGVPTNGDRTMWSSISGPTSLPPFPDANPGGFNKVAVTVTKDDVFVSINGAVDRKSRNKNTLVLDSLNIGQLSGNNNNMNGPLSEITYYPYAMTETELQELTANG